MSYSFRPAVRENVHLLLGMIGSTGSGKTYSALRLARGIAGDKPFAVLDTEARRALHYADRFKFDHADLLPPFRPAKYLEAIKAAEEAGYPVVVVDSMSHEHAGEGGLLEWHDEIQKRMAKGDEAKMERVNLAAWIEPKEEHKRMIGKLLQLRCHLILCFRAEEKVKPGKKDGKTVIESIGWQPICEKNTPYELTASFLLMADAPGVGKPLKLEEDHRPLFPEGALLDEEAGKRIALWAAGGKPATGGAPPPPATAKVNVTDFQTAMRDATSGAALADVWSKAVKACKAAKDNDAYYTLLRAKDKRKLELKL